MFGIHVMSFDFEAIGIFFWRLILALACSFAIGVERETKHRPAGLRTHMIVCVASMMIMTIGIALKNRYLVSSPGVDPSRLAAQIISGIGFLGAGTIIKGRDSVYGLTTAATLWAVACLGIAVGAGYSLEALLTTVVIMLTLRLITHIERLYRRRYSRYIFDLEVDGPYENVKTLLSILESNQMTMDFMNVTGNRMDGAKEFYRIRLGLRLKALHRRIGTNPIDLFEHFSFVHVIEEVKRPERRP